MAYSKYHSRKVTIDGITFDSVKEARRYSELSQLQKAGEISDLRRQVEFILIPDQREFTNDIYTKGRNKGCFKKGNLLERKCSYFADFVYFDKANKETIVEDTKGFRTPDYIIKRKLMLYFHGFIIKEV